MQQQSERQLYNLANPPYDLSTYAGRVKAFYSTTSPLTLFYSNASLKQAQQVVQRYQEKIKENGKHGYWVPLEQKKEFEHASQLVNSSIHPDTQEPILLPFRMSAFVPTNLIVCAGMLAPNPSLRSTIFWQVVNQSLNVAVNYSNSNRTVNMSTQEIGTAYLAATCTSVLLAVGLTKSVPRLPLSASTKNLLGKLVPFAAVASAGIVNISCIRWKEMRDGVEVFRLRRTADGNEEKEVVGKSPTAGKYAVGQSAMSRVLTNIPILTIPPLAMTWLHHQGAFNGPRGKLLSNAAQLSLIGLSLFVFLPPAIAYFPQRAEIDASKLEDRFHGIGEKLYFNKGL